MNELGKLFNKYGCDKAKKHKYDTVYGPHFEPIRNEPLKILEVGIFKGDSTRAWIDYLPNATIYGIDTFQRINPKEIDILQHERVKWIKYDSTNPALAGKIIKDWGNDIEFDAIIDDGLHTPEANGKTLTILFPFLASNGTYFIEDVWPIDIMSTKEMNHQWIKRHSDRYNIVKWEFFAKQLGDKDHERVDLRKKSGEPDSYIIKVTK